MGMIVNPHRFVAGGGGGGPPPGVVFQDVSYTGAYEEIANPGYNEITFLIGGGGGGGGAYGTNTSRGGGGGITAATFSGLAGNETFRFEIGQGGQGGVLSTSGGAGGWPDGGGGGRGDVACGGGGGSSRFYINGTLMLVAGAGGGASYDQGNGGVGGGTTGGTGYSTSAGHAGTQATGSAGTGGSQVAGGVDANDTGNANKTGRSIVSFPSSRTGGWGASTGDITTSTGDDGGGGGGGYYGGGGGGGDGSAGGGGSSWAHASATNVVHFQGLISMARFLPPGMASVCQGGRSVTSGTAAAGGNGFARIAFGSSAAEFGVLGGTDNTTNANTTADVKMTRTLTVPVGGIWVKEIQVGLGSSGLTAGVKFRGVIYNAISGAGVRNTNDTLFAATSGEYTVVTNDRHILVPMAFSSWTFLPAGDYWFGIHPDGASSIKIPASGGAGRNSNTDTYSDGASATYGGGAATTDGLHVALPYCLNDPT